MPILSHDVIRAPDTAPSSWMYFLHGIYGAGRNWATIARKLVRERPDWGAVLVDLREHGGSRGFAPPHTLAAAAADLVPLANDYPPRSIVAHSFGGKVALVYARDHRNPELRQLWIVDSTPDRRPPDGSAWAMLGVLRSTQGPFATRTDAVRELEAKGVANPVAQWISTNLVAGPDRQYRWRLDLDVMEALMLDFFEQDLWPFVENPPPGLTIRFLKGEASSVLGPDACSRLLQSGANGREVHLHRMEGGHWLNADDPEGVLALLLTHLDD